MNAPGIALRLVACTLVLSACAEPSAESPADESSDVELIEIARIGTLDGAPEFQFSSPSANIVVDHEAGEVFVAEPQTREIRVFSLSGEFLRRFGRAGDGPGEFDEAPTFAVARDTVVALDRSRLHFFDRSGEVLQTTRVSTVDGLPLPFGVSADSAGFVGWFMESDPYDADAGPFERMYRIDPVDASLGEPVVEIEHDQTALGLFAEQTRMVHAGDSFVRTIGDGYELGVLSLEGWPVDTLRFEWEPVPVPSDAFESFATARRSACDEAEDPAQCLRSAERQIERYRDRPIPDLRPVIGGLTGSPDGLVLVLRADLDPEPHASGTTTRRDLVSTSGELLAELDLPDGFRPRWFSRDEIWGFELDEFDVPYVVGYEMRR